MELRRVEYEWLELASGVQQAVVNGRQVRAIREGGVWRVEIDKVPQMERYETDGAARSDGERYAFIR